MKKRVSCYLVFILLLSILLCSACQKKQINQEYYDYQKGFSYYNGQTIVSTPKGYYFLVLLMINKM